MKKYWLCLISVVVFFTVSCNKNTSVIKIDWVVLCDISDVDFNEMPIELEFSNENTDQTFKLIPNRTKKNKNTK